MNHPNPVTNNSKKTFSIFQGDKFLCFLLFLIGTAGLYCIFFAPKAKKTIVYNQPKPAAPVPPSTVPNTRPVQVALNQLDIRGDYEAKEKLTFHIPRFDKKLSYELDLGNHKTIKVDKPTVHYTYRRSGKYKVKLWGTYKEEKKLLHRETIRVYEAIEVAENAFYEVED